MIEYYRLLLAYADLKETRESVSVFEISGYPHYEIVCSNVLAFYLNPKREHGLGDLILSSLLKQAGHELETTNSSVDVLREYSTSAGGRLDLLVVTDSFAIGIENKIFSGVQNDLKDYRKTIDTRAAGKLVPVPVILSPRPVALDDYHGFVNITYPALWNNVKLKLGFHTGNADPKWVMYLHDFIATTNALAGVSMQSHEREDFFIQNEPLISKLIDERAKFIGRLNAQVRHLKEILDASDNVSPYFDKRWIYASSCLVHDYTISGNNIAFDLYISLSGWELQVFGRGNPSHAFLRALMASKYPDVPIQRERFILGKWPIRCDIGLIRQELCRWMTSIVKVG